ncbi:MAG: hypothetical protein ACE5K4_08885 [Candidatus Hydrothermarchaeota archaeon]
MRRRRSFILLIFILLLITSMATPAFSKFQIYISKFKGLEVKPGESLEFSVGSNEPCTVELILPEELVSDKIRKEIGKIPNNYVTFILKAKKDAKPGYYRVDVICYQNGNEVGRDYALVNIKGVKEKVVEKRKTLEIFPESFLLEGKINTKIVIGSGAPAQDLVSAIDLSTYLGSFAKRGEFSSSSTDKDVSDAIFANNNLVVIGGPAINTICARINENLPVRFSKNKDWSIVSEKGKYYEPGTGVVEIITNPKNPEKTILVVAGLDRWGTYAGVRYLISSKTKISKQYLIVKKEKGSIRILESG